MAIYSRNSGIVTYGMGAMTISQPSPGPTPGTAEILGRTYRTVVIDGREWLAENFMHDDGGAGTMLVEVYSWYGEHDYIGECNFYTWTAAMRIAALATGWHIPTAAEWDSLITYAGGEGNMDVMDNLCANTTWSIGPWTDTMNFSILPYGYLNFAGDSPQFPGAMVSIWSSTQPDDSSAYKYQFDSDYIFKRTDGTDGICNVVRLIRDI